MSKPEAQGESEHAALAHTTRRECLRVFMKYPGVPAAYCELECFLCQAHDADEASFEMVATGRLAYNLGLRNGDILLSINLTSVNRVSVAAIIETLQWLDVSRPIIVGLKRIRQNQEEFCWFVFKLVIVGGKPAIHLISKHCVTSPEDVPTFEVDFQEVDTFDYQPPPDTVEIIQQTSQLYLSVQNGQLEFNTYDASTSKFSKYKYSGSHPDRGVPSALVNQVPPGSHAETDSCIEANFRSGVVQLGLTNFPPYMTGSRPISSNGRFFYQTLSDNRAYHLFVNETQSGYCIAKSPDSNEAIAEKPPTSCSEMRVEALPN